MRTGVARDRELSIVKGLAAVEKSRVERDLLIGMPADGDERGVEDGNPTPHEDPYERDGTLASNGRNRRIVLSESSTCGVCRRRFGRAAVRVLVDGGVVHYGCGGGGGGVGGGTGTGAWGGGGKGLGASFEREPPGAAAGGPRTLGR